jgi:RNA polymerase sigma-70 factor (ECF subfamily)
VPSADDELEQWAREVLPRAVAYARTLLNPPAEAEDVVQDVLCRLLDHDEYDLPADGEKLLFRSITNACINAVTRRRQLASLDGAEHPPLRDPLSASTPRDPAEVTASREVLDTVEDELKELPEMQRAAVELKALGRSLKHIADVLEVSASNAGVLVHRGRKKLRSRLGDRLPGELE